MKKRGISEEEIAEIPTREFRGLCDEEEECRICLMTYETPDWLRTLTCNHEFHMTCIDKWLLVKLSIPSVTFKSLKPAAHLTKCTCSKLYLKACPFKNGFLKGNKISNFLCVRLLYTCTFFRSVTLRFQPNFKTPSKYH